MLPHFLFVLDFLYGFVNDHVLVLFALDLEQYKNKCEYHGSDTIYECLEEELIRDTLVAYT